MQCLGAAEVGEVQENQPAGLVSDHLATVSYGFRASSVQC